MPIAVLVTVRTTDDAPVDGAIVSFKTTSGVFVADTETDDAGEASIDLDEGTYLVRPYKSGISFQANTRIEVVDGEDNTWDIEGIDTNTHPLAPDTAMCRVTGGWVSGTGAPFGGIVSMELIVIWPRVFRGQPIARKATATTFARQNGGQPQAYMDFTLIQGGIYEIGGVPSRHESLRVKVPSRRYCGLTELIYPYPEDVSWGGSASLTLARGAVVTRTVTLTLTSGVVIPHSWMDGAGEYHRISDWATISVGDSRIVDAEMDYASGELRLTGRTAGTTDITIELLPTIVDDRAPLDPITFTPLTVTVT
jgi:hypothetical protein